MHVVIASADCYYSGSSAVDTCTSDGDFSFLSVMILGIVALMVMSALGLLIYRIYFNVRYRNPVARRRARSFVDSTGELAEIEQKIQAAEAQKKLFVTLWRDRDPSVDYSTVDRLGTKERSGRYTAIESELQRLRRQAVRLKSTRR
jgi:hypothetical protein